MRGNQKVIHPHGLGGGPGNRALVAAAGAHGLRRLAAWRVRERVAQGGHDVPDVDIRRRYARSLSNARRLVPIVHQALVFDNSGAEPRPVFEMPQGQLLSTADEIPTWATTLLE